MTTRPILPHDGAEGKVSAGSRIVIVALQLSSLPINNDKRYPAEHREEKE